MQNNKNFDSQLQAYFSSIKHSIKQQHVSYLKEHPQLRQILNDFLSSCLLEQPDNVYEYAKKFFSYFNYQKDTVKYSPLVLSGCSGAGKGTLVKKLLSKYPDIFELSISYTTRNARQGQVHGREYYFVKKQDFEKVTDFFILRKSPKRSSCNTAKSTTTTTALIRANLTISQAGEKYLEILCEIPILEIDLQGGEKVKASGFESNFIFIDVPSLEVLRQRLTGRGTQTEQVVNKRMKNAEGELQHVSRLPYYERIMNDSLETCYKHLIQRINGLYGLSLE